MEYSLASFMILPFLFYNLILYKIRYVNIILSIKVDFGLF